MTLNPFKWFRDTTQFDSLTYRLESIYDSLGIAHRKLNSIHNLEEKIMATEGDNQQLLGVINAELSELISRQKPPVATQANIDEDNAVLTAIQGKLKTLLEPTT